MKYVRAQIEIPKLETPLTTLAEVDAVKAVYLLAGGVSDTPTPTYTLSIEAPENVVRDLFSTDADVIEWEITSTDGETVYAYVQFRAPPAVSHFREQFTRDSLIVLLPATFHPDSIEITVVGTQSDLSYAFETLPADFETEVLEVGTFHRGIYRGRSLTERQREVLEVAYELGYYERPSETTHEEIAAELGCAASTVGEHLRNAEQRLVREVLE